MADYHGKVAVVTGAASGIGLAIAERAGREGMTVVLADVDREGLTKARAMLDDQGMRVHAMEVDVSDRGSVTGVAGRLRREGRQPRQRGGVRADKSPGVESGTRGLQRPSTARPRRPDAADSAGDTRP